jgi:polyhydroxybutyrate depolymerase
MRKLAYVVLVMTVLLPLAAACGKDDPTPDAGATTPGPIATTPGTSTISLDDRPFLLHVPTTYDPAEAVPLVIGLHGYTSNSTEMESYFKLVAESDERGFLYAMPDGTTDRRGDQFWNATNACCDFNASGVDDSAYLSKLIETVQDSYSVDRVFLIGHSNGGYMAHRMACEHADQVTAIASLAGVLWSDPARCTPSRPVTVLQIHGTGDTTVSYAGGDFGGGRTFPGAEATVAQWREDDGCTDTADTTAPPLDLDFAADGAETTVTAYREGCGDGRLVELWSMAGSGHVPRLTDAFTPAVLDFLYASTT